VPEKPTSPDASRDRDVGKAEPTDRERRRAEALRANLHRRKTQSRSRENSQSRAPSRDGEPD
jgi:hypothetical protein